MGWANEGWQLVVRNLKMHLHSSFHKVNKVCKIDVIGGQAPPKALCHYDYSLFPTFLLFLFFLDFSGSEI